MGMVEPKTVQDEPGVYNLRVMLPSNQGVYPDPITLQAAVYLMLSGTRVGWGPISNDGPQPWDVSRGEVLPSDEIRARATKRGWVYLP